jgi:hypothetical protein
MPKIELLLFALSLKDTDLLKAIINNNIDNALHITEDRATNYLQIKTAILKLKAQYSQNTRPILIYC